MINSSSNAFGGAILCDPAHIEPTGYLSWCIDAEDVYTLQDNAVCKATLATWEDVGKEVDALECFNFILVCAPPGPARDEIVSELTARTTVAVLVPQKDAFYGCENIRSLLASKGTWAVSRLLYGAEEVAIQDIIDLSTVDTSKQLNAERTLSGFRALDSAIGGFSPGDLSVWTGKRGDGKSTLLGQVLLEAVNQGHKVCAYSGELPARQFKLSMLQQAAGRHNVVRREDERTGRILYRVPQETANVIDDWWKGHLFLTDIRRDNAHNEDNILRLFEYARRRYGCDTFLVDNIMTAELRDAAELGHWQAQSKFTGRLVAFAKARDVHVHLVAHPRKTERRLEADDVGGSSDITNRADNVIKVERVKDEQIIEAGYCALLTVLKNREFGAMPKVELDFDESSRRFYPANTDDTRVFSWERMVSAGGP